MDLKDAHLSVPIAPEHCRFPRPQVHMEELVVRVPVSSTWAHQCPMGVHQAVEAGDVTQDTGRHSLYTIC